MQPRSQRPTRAVESLSSTWSNGVHIRKGFSQLGVCPIRREPDA